MSTRVSPPKTTSDDDALVAVRAGAIRLLARREHSSLELSRKLELKGHAGELVASVLRALADEGLLSDTRYAEAYARGRLARGYGPLRIGQELRQRGVPAAVVQDTLAALDPLLGEEIERLHRRRFEGVPRDGADEVRRLHYFRQRGFTAEQVRRLWRGD